MVRRCCFFILFVFSAALFSQELCVSDQIYHLNKTLNSGVESEVDFEAWMSKVIARKMTQKSGHEKLYRLPVVFHMLSNTSITPEYIQKLVEHANDYLRKQVEEAQNDDRAVDLNIELTLAKYGPNNELLTELGIHRFNPSDSTSFPLPPYSTTSLKLYRKVMPKTKWNFNEYVNIWVIPLSNQGVMGYASFPNIGNFIILNEDFLVTGLNNISHEFFYGRLLAHEFGHYVSLFHLWGNSILRKNIIPCLFSTDYCDDTPQQANSTAYCNQIKKTCGSVDMIENMMDYSECKYMFTQDQKNRVRATLEERKNRKGLLNSTKIGLDTCGMIVSVKTTNTTDVFSSDGTATVLVNGGTPPYQIQWSTGLNQVSIGGLSANEQYSVTVHDDNNCPSTGYGDVESDCNITAEVNILSYETSFAKHNGVAEVINITGGTPPYNFLWENGETSQIATKLNKIHADVFISDQTGSCYVQIPIRKRNQNYCDEVVFQPRGILEWDVFPSPINSNWLTARYTIINAHLISNLAFNNNQIDHDSIHQSIRIHTGAPTNSYHLNVSFDLSNAVDSSVQNCAFDYPVFINDSNCNQSSLENILTQQVNPSIFGARDGSIHCNDTNYNYQWSTGETTPNLLNIPAGLYRVTISSDLNCHKVKQFILKSEFNICGDPLLRMSEPLIQDNDEFDIQAIQVGDSLAKVYIKDGYPGYKIAWSSGDSNQVASGLDPGDYYVTVIDNSGLGCELVDVVIIVPVATGILDCSSSQAISCDQTLSVASSSDGSNVDAYSCNNWSETGPERVFTYTPASDGAFSAKLSNFSGADLDVYILGSCDPDDCIGTTDSDSAYFSGGIAGTTYYIVIDADAGSGVACDLTLSCYAVDSTSNNTCAIEVMVDVTPESGAGLNDGMADATQTGASLFSYQYYTLADSLISNTDPTGNLAPADYYVVGYDNAISGCSDTAYFTIEAFSADTSQNPQDSCLLSVNIIPTHPTTSISNDGSLLAEVTGAEGPYTFLWSNQGVLDQLDSLPEGSYTVTVTNSVGCVAISSIALNAIDTSSNPIDTTITIDDSCTFTIGVSGTDVSAIGAEDGAANVQVNQPGTYTYLWNTGDTSPAIYGLSSGSYGVSVTDTLGCTLFKLVAVNAPDGQDTNATSIQLSVQQLNQAIVLYPNPVADVLHINFKEEVNAPFEIYNMSGQGLYSSRIKHFKKDQVHKLDLSYISKGNYFLTVTLKNGNKATKPFVVYRL